MKKVIKLSPDITIPHTEMDIRNIYLLCYRGRTVNDNIKVDWSLIIPSGGYDKEVCAAIVNDLFTKGNKAIEIKPCKTLWELVELLPDGYEIFEFETFFEMCKFYVNHPDAYTGE